MKNASIVVFVIVLIISLAACGSTEVAEGPTVTNTAVPATATTVPDPSSTPSPTTTTEPTVTPQPAQTLAPTETATPLPTGTPEPTATPDPLADFEEFAHEEMGLQVHYPAAWVVEEDAAAGVVMLSENAQASIGEDQAILLIVGESEAGTAVATVELFLEEFISMGILPDDAATDDPVIFTINDQDAAQTAVESELPDGLTIYHWATVVQAGERTVIVLSFGPMDTAEDLRPTYDLVTSSILLSSPNIDNSVYFVGEYDPARDPAADLDEALLIAQEERKHVLLVVGGDWCPDCLVSRFRHP